MNITEICIRKPVLAWMIMGATVLFGTIAVWQIGISQFPDVDFPTVNISASWEGAAPEVMENDVVELLEEAVVQIEGVKSITSTSRQGSANVTVELDLSRDVDLALQDVDARVSQVRQRLPVEVETNISKTNPEDNPIMWVGLSGPFSRQMLADIARYRIKERLQKVDGVGEINMGGYLDRNVRIWLDAAKLDERGVTVSDIVDALRAQHVERPAGRIETPGREVNVRVVGEAIDIATLESIVVRNVEGVPVRLKDVSLVEDGFEDERRRSRVDGVPAQGLGIRKKRGSNAVAVAQGVKAELRKLQETLPEGMVLGVNFDSTQFIEESVHEIELELILAVVLTALVCWMFLASFSSTLNVILAIPMSLLGTIAVIYFLGFTLNTFTLLGLSLAVGIVVDDAIMVLENVHRHAEMGKDRVRAAREGTAEITFAALAATVAVVAIFIPVVFMPGIIGRFFLQFGITLSIAVLLSYVEAITLAPARLSQTLVVGRHDRGRVGRGVDRAFTWLEVRYARALAFTLKPRWSVVAIQALVFFLVISAATVGFFVWLPKEFTPSQDQSRLMLRLQTAVGSSLDESDLLMKRAEEFVRGRPEIERAFVVIGGFGGAGVNTGIMFLTLKPPDQRMPQAEFQAVLRKELNSWPGLRAVVQDLSQSGFTANRGFPVEFSVRGPDWEELVTHATAMREELQQTGMVQDVDWDYVLGMPELRIEPLRDRANDIGVEVNDIATTINALVGGVRVGKYSSGGRRVDVRMRLRASQRTRPEDVAKLKVRSRDDTLVPLATVVKYEERSALQAITRKDRERAITVFGNIAPGKSQGEALAEVRRISKTLPPSYTAVFGGASATASESGTALFLAFALGLLIAYMVLGGQFNSFLHPLTVLTIVPISIFGALIALKLGGHSLNIFSGIGLMLLAGIVKKNSIILVDYANQARGRGADAKAAMLEAGPVRLRPILMTSIATMMAALPAALGLGAGSEVRMPMAVGVIGGLIVSTVLSLLVVPAIYVAFDGLKQSLVRRLGGDKAVHARS